MKKNVFTILIIMLCFTTFAQDKVFSPTLLSPADNSENINVNVLLNWSPVAGAFKYEFMIDRNINFTEPVIQGETQFSAKNTYNLEYGVVYYWRVRAIDIQNVISEWSAVRSFKTRALPVLVSPKDAITTTPSNEEIVIHTKSDTLLVVIQPSVTEYIVTTPDSSVVLYLVDSTVTIKITSDTTISLYSDPSGYELELEIPATYTFKPANYSAPISLTVLNNTYDFVPAISDTAKYTYNISPYFRWNLLHGSTNYIIEVDTTPHFNSAYTKTKLASAVDTAIIDLYYYGQSYYFRTKAFHSSDTSDWSVVNYFSTMQNPKLDKPNPSIGVTHLNVTPIVDIEWHGIIGSTQFQYEYSTDSTFATSQIVDVPYSAFTISYPTPNNPTIRNGIVKTPADTLPYGEKIYWRARSISQADTSMWSLPFWLQTIAKVTLSQPANQAANISLKPKLQWKAIKGSISYEVEYSKEQDFTDAVNMIVPHPATGEDVFFDITHPLDTVSTYFWRVRAISTRDISDWATASFTTMSSVSIESFNIEDHLSIYPNPSNGKFYFDINVPQVSDYSIEVSNIIGQIVHTQTGDFVRGKNNIVCKIENIQNGVYFVTIQFEKHKLTRKIVISK